MLRDTPQARARIRELVSLFDKAAMQFGSWCHKGSPICTGREPQSRDAGMSAPDACRGRLRLCPTRWPGAQATIADCVAMATVLFAEGLYGVPLAID